MTTPSSIPPRARPWPPIAIATDAELEQALAAADAAATGWARTSSVAERAALIRRVAELHRERRDELAAIIVREMGKPLAAALGEVDFAADITEYYADNAEQIMRDQPIDILGEGTAVIRRSPLGVLLGIMPWNFPYYQVARFAAPNLLIGNPILLKHASQCPESSAAIAAMYRDAGFPDGAYTNLYLDQRAGRRGDRRSARARGVGDRLGARRCGRGRSRGAQPQEGRRSSSADRTPSSCCRRTTWMRAVQAAADARLDNTGQSCNAAKRFIVVDDLYEPFLEKFTAIMTGSKLGDPFADDTVLGPLSSQVAAERLAEQVDKAVAQGATLVAGGTRDGAFYPATVLTDVTPEMDAYREEFFGPVGVVYRVADEDEAVKIANDTPFGLGSYVFTTDEEQAERVADKIEAGMVYVNLVLADSPELPFGGVKRSGTGREMGLLAADEFVNKKLVRVGA